jgi:hypothetical protein
LEELMKAIATLVLTIALMVPATALATSSSTCQAYSGQTCSVLSTTQQNAATGATNSGSLPFTGLDVVLLLIGSGALIGTGLVVRAFTRRVN